MRLAPTRDRWLSTGLARAVVPALLTAAVAAGAYTGSREMSTVEAGHRDYSRRAEHAVPADDLYKSPLQLVLSPDGRRLYVACENTDEILVVDTRKRRVTGAIDVGPEPFDMLFSPSGDSLYVSHRWSNDIGVVDLLEGRLVGRIAAGDDPHDMALSPDHRLLFVANLGTDDVSVIERAIGTEIKRLTAGHAPFGMASSPDGKSIYVSSQYSLPVPFRTPSILELTVLDVERQLVRERRNLFSTVIGQGIATTSDGHFAVTAVELPKNLIPQTQVYQGWMVTYGLAFTETRKRGRTAYLLIDEPNLYFADPYDVVVTPDGSQLYVSSSGANAVTVIDLERAYAVLEVADGKIGLSDGQIATYARHLGLSSEYVDGRIPTGANPKGMAVSPGGRWVYVAERLEDRILVIDTRKQRADGHIVLGGPAEETVLRRGAKVFSFASISFQKQMSCATCHPENSVDGLLYDIAVDGGMGRNLVDNLSLRGFADTAPFKWTGKNPNLQRQEGPRAAQLFFRTHGFAADENEAIVAYLESLPQRPNRYLSPDGRLNEFQRLGKEMFERGYDNRGRYIPVNNRCITCHPRPYGTDRRRHDIGSTADHDWDGTFDTPHLINTYERPPYMHDGRCYSLEEIWTEHNMDDTHGVTNDMTKDQLNALIEYIKTF